MKHLLTIILLVTAITNFKAQQQNPSVKPLVIGEIHTIKSKILSEDRILNIYLPSTFDKTKSYPVMYVLDGTINEDFLHITGLVQFFNMSFNMPDVIVVGVANVDRRRDFTFPTTIADLKKDYPTTGHSDKFIKFLAEELQPYITATFKTNGTNYLIGQSLGGLVATEILFKKPALFSHYLIVSPSLWWDDQTLMQKAAALLANADLSKTYVYVAVGKGEHPIMIRDAMNLVDALKKLKKPTVSYEVMSDENHATILHNSIYQAFLKLFPYKE
jgi:hypothetical protein